MLGARPLSLPSRTRRSFNNNAEDPLWRAATKNPKAIRRLACYLANLFAARAMNATCDGFKAKTVQSTM